MPLVRMLVSWNGDSDPPKYVFTNTLYFNVSGSVDDPDYPDLCADLAQIYREQLFTGGRVITVRAYDMADAKPREPKATATSPVGSTSRPAGAPQVALCLSYYADRNLPRSRGRIYTGPWSSDERPTIQRMQGLITLGQGLAGLGGLNVDWSLYSPRTGDHTRISNIWVDNSWDIIRGRKIDGTLRQQATING